MSTLRIQFIFSYRVACTSAVCLGSHSTRPRFRSLIFIYSNVLDSLVHFVNDTFRLESIIKNFCYILFPIVFGIFLTREEIDD